VSPASGDAGGLVVRNLAKRFGTTAVLRDVSFDAPRGRMTVLVGPSGCGKTTLLRIVAGFETADGGSVSLHGATLEGGGAPPVPPEKRSAAIVFQHFALFPQMTVAENVGYGPRVQRRTREERDRAVAEMLGLAEIPDLAGRRPAQLSGGQQQRVALARALAAEPKLLLLDEPLSNVDPTVRRETRGRIRAMQLSRGLTALWVTHDREEALAVADRIVVLRGGEVVQSGSPREVCETPAAPFVAELLLGANVLTPSAAFTALEMTTAETVAIRPDRVGLERVPGGPLRVVSVQYGPVHTEILTEGVLAMSGERIQLRASLVTDELPPGLAPGVFVRAFVRPIHVIRFPPRAASR
jgi:putative spermidine/putrescine transport system ATP-binding protein